MRFFIVCGTLFLSACSGSVVYDSGLVPLPPHEAPPAPLPLTLPESIPNGAPKPTPQRMTFEIDPQQPLDFPAAFKALLNPKRANPFDITNAPDSVDASMSLTSVSRQENSRQTEATIANFQLSTKIGDSEFTRNFKSEGKAIAVQLDGGEDQLNAQLVSTDRAKTKLYLEITRKHVGPHNLGDLFRNEWSGTLSSKIPDDDKNDDNDKVVVLGTLKGFINTH